VTRIDAHHHLWDLKRREQAWLDVAELADIRRTFTVADYASEAAAAGFDGSVLVQVLADVDETREFLALAADSYTAVDTTVGATVGAAIDATADSAVGVADVRDVRDVRRDVPSTADMTGVTGVTGIVGVPGTADTVSVVGVVGWIDLTAPDVADELAALRADPGGDLLVGIRHLVQGEADPRWLCRPDVRRGLQAVAEAGLCYDLLTLPHQLPAAIETVRALPQLTFVLDHLSKPPIASGELEPWATDLRELAAEPNVLCKLSGMVTETDHTSWTVASLRPYADVALEAFGPSRVMFGSDWPVCLLAASYAQVAEAAAQLVGELSSAEQDQIFGGTAVHAYRLRT
jgi:L-fuconolactonase